MGRSAGEGDGAEEGKGTAQVGTGSKGRETGRETAPDRMGRSAGEADGASGYREEGRVMGR